MSKHAVNADDIISRSNQGTRFMQVAYYNQVPASYEPNQLVTAAYVDSRINGGGIKRYTVNPGDPEVSYNADYSRITVSYSSGVIANAIGPGFPLIRQLLVNQGGDDYYEVQGSHVTVPAGEVSTVYWEGAMDQATYNSGNWFITLGN